MEHKPIGNEKEVNHKKERILHFVLDFLGVTCIAVFFYVAFPIFNFFETGRLETDDLARFICVGAVYIIGLIYILVKHLKKGIFTKSYKSAEYFKADGILHRCSVCGDCLDIRNRRKIVDRYSEEGQYYEFTTQYYNHFTRSSHYEEHYHKGQKVTKCEFVHKAYYCKKCDYYVEFITQHSFDKIDKHFKNHCKNHGLQYKKKFLDKNGNELSFPKDIENISSCEITLFNAQEVVGVHSLPVKRLQQNERAHYFDISSIK